MAEVTKEMVEAACCQHWDTWNTKFHDDRTKRQMRSMMRRTLTAAENARKAEPVAKQWRALEDGHPKTSWKSPELGDLAGWEIWAAGSGGRTVIEYRDLYSTPPQQDDLRKAVIEEAAAYHDDLAAHHSACHEHVVSDHHEMMEKKHRRDAAAIRALAGGE